MASIISAGTTSGTALNMAGDTSGVLQLATNGSTTAVTIDASQNVGIGTTSPEAPLHIFRSSSPYTLYRNSTTTDGSSIGVNSGSSDMFLYNADAGSIILSTNATERMRIDSSGNVLVGTTSQITTGGFSPKLSITNAGNAAFFTTSTNASIMGMQINTNGGDGIKFYNASASNVGNITINSGGTAYGTTSDYRLKENIAPMTGALEKVSLLKPVIYTWKTDDSNGQGFIAHELQAIIPDAVVGEKDAVNEDGSIKPQCIDTSFLVATLTAAIQEQQTIINDLKARITALEGVA
jgi:hypothetical protein